MGPILWKRPYSCTACCMEKKVSVMQVLAGSGDSVGNMASETYFYKQKKLSADTEGRDKVPLLLYKVYERRVLLHSKFLIAMRHA